MVLNKEEEDLRDSITQEKKKKRVRDEAKISYIYSPNDAVLNIKELFFKSWVR
jgi:hypothetical protein